MARHLCTILVTLLVGSSLAVAGERGTIAITSETSGAGVFVDGTFQGLLPLEAPLPVDPGAHSVAIVKPGHADFSGSVEVVAGETTDVEVDLLPLDPQVSITDGDGVFELMVDGQYVGKLPKVVTLAPGTHDLVVSEYGDGAASTVIQAKPGEVYDLEVDVASPSSPWKSHEILPEPTAIDELVEAGQGSLSSTVPTWTSPPLPDPTPIDMTTTSLEPHRWYESTLGWALMGLGYLGLTASMLLHGPETSEGFTAAFVGGTSVTLGLTTFALSRTVDWLP